MDLHFVKTTSYSNKLEPETSYKVYCHDYDSKGNLKVYLTELSKEELKEVVDFIKKSMD